MFEHGYNIAESTLLYLLHLPTLVVQKKYVSVDYLKPLGLKCSNLSKNNDKTKTLTISPAAFTKRNNCFNNETGKERNSSPRSKKTLIAENVTKIFNEEEMDEEEQKQRLLYRFNMVTGEDCRKHIDLYASQSSVLTQSENDSQEKTDRTMKDKGVKLSSNPNKSNMPHKGSEPFPRDLMELVIDSALNLIRIYLIRLIACVEIELDCTLDLSIIDSIRTEYDLYLGILLSASQEAIPICKSTKVNKKNNKSAKLLSPRRSKEVLINPKSEDLQKIGIRSKDQFERLIKSPTRRRQIMMKLEAVKDCNPKISIYTNREIETQKIRIKLAMDPIVLYNRLMILIMIVEKLNMVHCPSNDWENLSDKEASTRLAHTIPTLLEAFQQIWRCYENHIITEKGNLEKKNAKIIGKKKKSGSS